MPKLRNILASAKARAGSSKLGKNLNAARSTERGQRVLQAGAGMLNEQMNTPMEDDSAAATHALGVGEPLSPLQSRTGGPSHAPMKEE